MLLPYSNLKTIRGIRCDLSTPTALLLLSACGAATIPRCPRLPPSPPRNRPAPPSSRPCNPESLSITPTLQPSYSPHYTLYKPYKLTPLIPPNSPTSSTYAKIKKTPGGGSFPKVTRPRPGRVKLYPHHTTPDAARSTWPRFCWPSTLKLFRSYGIK